MRFREVRLRKDPRCAACGENASIRSVGAIEDPCRSPLEPRGLDGRSDEIRVAELKERLARDSSPILVDVRSAAERLLGAIPGSIHIPLAEIEARLSELDPVAEIVVFCRTGARSAHASRILHEAGFHRAKNLAGGFDAWEREAG